MQALLVPWIDGSNEPALAGFLDRSIRCIKYSTESIMNICHSGPSSILYIFEVSVVLYLAFGDIPSCYTSNQDADADGKIKGVYNGKGILLYIHECMLFYIHVCKQAWNMPYKVRHHFLSCCILFIDT